MKVVKKIHLIESNWNEAKTEQVIGRAVRQNQVCVRSRNLESKIVLF